MSIQYISSVPTTSAENLTGENHRSKFAKNVNKAVDEGFRLGQTEDVLKEKTLVNKDREEVAKESSLLGRAMLALQELIRGDKLVYHMVGEDPEAVATPEK